MFCVSPIFYIEKLQQTSHFRLDCCLPKLVLVELFQIENFFTTAKNFHLKAYSRSNFFFFFYINLISVLQTSELQPIYN
jgi:hypothetical protein